MPKRLYDKKIICYDIITQLKKLFLFSSLTLDSFRYWLFDKSVTKELLELQKIMNDKI